MSFIHINVNCIDVKGLIDEMRHIVYSVTSYKSHAPTQTHITIEMRTFKNVNIDDFCNDLYLCG